MKLIGIDEQLSKLESWLRTWEYQDKKAALLWSEGPGRGKTSSVYYVAEKLGYEVIEFNASEDRKRDFFIKKIKPICLSKTFVKSLVLLDEAEHIPKESMRILGELLKITKKPIILTANDVSGLLRIRNLCFEIYYPPPSPQTIIKLAKMYGVKQGFSKFGNVADLRQLELMVRHESEGYLAKSLTRKSRLHKSLTSGNYRFEDENDLIYLLDTFFSCLTGLDLVIAFEFLSLANVKNDYGNLDAYKAQKVFDGLKFKIREDQIKETFFTLQREEQRR